MGTEADQALEEDLIPTDISVPKYLEEYKNDPRIITPPYKEGAVDAIIYECCDDGKWYIAGSNSRRHCTEKGRYGEIWPSCYNGVFNFDEAYERFMLLSEDETTLHDRGYDDIYLIHVGPSPEAFLSEDDRDAYFSSNYRVLQMEVGKSARKKAQNVGEDLNPEFIPEPPYDKEFINDSSVYLKPEQIEELIQEHRDERVWMVRAYIRDEFESEFNVSIISHWHTVMSGTFDEAYEAFLNTELSDDLTRVSVLFTGEDADFKIRFIEPCVLIKKFKAQNTEYVREDLEATAMPIDFDPRFLNAYSMLDEDELMEIILSKCDTPSWYTVAYDSFGQREGRKDDATFKEAYKAFCDCNIGDKTSFGTDITTVRMFYEGGGYGPICPCVLVKHIDDLGYVSEDLDPEAMEPISWRYMKQIQHLRTPFSMDIADEIIQTFGASDVWSVFCDPDGLVGEHMNFDEAFKVFEETYKKLNRESWREWKEIQLAYHGEYPPDYVAGRNTGDILNWVILKKYNPYGAARRALLPEDLEPTAIPEPEYDSRFLVRFHHTHMDCLPEELQKALIRHFADDRVWDVNAYEHSPFGGYHIEHIGGASLTFDEAYKEFVGFDASKSRYTDWKDAQVFLTFSLPQGEELPSGFEEYRNGMLGRLVTIMLREVENPDSTGLPEVSEDLEANEIPLPKFDAKYLNSDDYSEHYLNQLIQENAYEACWSVFAREGGVVTDHITKLTFDEAYRRFLDYTTDRRGRTSVFIVGDTLLVDNQDDHRPDFYVSCTVMKRTLKDGKDITEDLEPEVLSMPKVLTSWREMLPKDGDHVTQIRWGDEVTDDLILEYGEDKCWSLWDSDGVIDDKFDVSFEEAFNTFLEKCGTTNTLDICFHGKSPLKLAVSAGEMGGDYDWMVICRRLADEQAYQPPRPL